MSRAFLKNKTMIYIRKNTFRISCIMLILETLN